jgi:hypothetical protein
MQEKPSKLAGLNRGYMVGYGFHKNRGYGFGTGSRNSTTGNESEFGG